MGTLATIRENGMKLQRAMACLALTLGACATSAPPADATADAKAIAALAPEAGVRFEPRVFPSNEKVHEAVKPAGGKALKRAATR